MNPNDLRQVVTDLERIAEKLARAVPAERRRPASSDTAGPLGTHKGLHHDANIRALLNRLTAMESEGYAVTTHEQGKVEISYPSGGSVYLAFSVSADEWVAIEHDEWGIE